MNVFDQKPTEMRRRKKTYIQKPDSDLLRNI